MPLPGNITTRTLTGTYTAPTGGPGAGTVIIDTLPQVLTDATAPAFIAGATTLDVDLTGHITVTLPCTDDPDLSPTGWVYRITENIVGRPQRVYYIPLVYGDGSPVDLAEIAPVSPPPTQYSTVYGVLGQPNTWSSPNTFPDLAVTGVFTLDGTPIAAPPGGTTLYLRADGTWHTPAGGGGGAVDSVNGLTGTVVLTATSVAAIPEAVVTTKGDLLVAAASGTVIRLAAGADGTLLEADSGQPGGLAWTPPPQPDRDARMFGLAGMPFSPYMVSHVDLGASPGFVIAMLIRPGRATITDLGLWLGTAGVTPNGVNAMALYSEAGAQLGITGDMSSALSDPASNSKYVEAAMGAAVQTADATDYYVTVLCHMGSNPQIAGFLDVTVPVIKGNPPALAFGGQATLPASFDPQTAALAGAAYWLVAS